MKRAHGGARRKGIKEELNASIIHLPARASQRDGLVGFYRAPRTPADQVLAGAEALRRIARLSEQAGSPILPDEVRDVAEWLENGCVPRWERTA
jgi:hypothetical protein